MRTWSLRLFGREVASVEQRDEVTLSDVVSRLIEDHVSVEELDEDTDDGVLGDVIDQPCEFCGEMLAEDSPPAGDDVASRFADMTERIVWGPDTDNTEGT